MTYAPIYRALTEAFDSPAREEGMPYMRVVGSGSGCRQKRFKGVPPAQTGSARVGIEVTPLNLWRSAGERRRGEVHCFDCLYGKPPHPQALITLAEIKKG